MTPPISMVLTIHDRPPEVSKAVAESLCLPGNAPGELILVLDRPTEEAREGAHAAYDDLPFPVRTITIPANPTSGAGWLCPARAWNHGFKAASGDYLYCISSEVVQETGNVDRARAAVDENTAVFGACENSKPLPLVTGAPKGFLAGSELPRPLGFIVCMPRLSVTAIGGFDEAFMDGYWYDDDDFFYRLWQSGLNFTFDDSIKGVHLDHARPRLETPEGQAGIGRNQALMLKKHGDTHVWPNLEKMVSYGPGITRWRHF